MSPFRLFYSFFGLATLLPLSASAENAYESELFKIYAALPGSEEPRLVFLANPSHFSSAALQQYLVPPYRITEFSLSFVGQGNKIRFYSMEETESPTARGSRAMDHAAANLPGSPGSARSDPEVWKSYPHTTHAGTAEFLLSSPEEVRDLHQAFADLFREEESLTEALRGTSLEIDSP